MARVGVLALQGGFAAHGAALERCGHEVVEVRSAEAFEGLDGLVLPGGESPTQLKLLARHGISRALDGFARSGRPVLATCAGLILAARHVGSPEQSSFGWLAVSVARNGWGRQIASFEARSDEGGLPLVFIRAPRIVEVAHDVEVLARFRGEPVLVRQGRVVGATFHPELTRDVSIVRDVFG